MVIQNGTESKKDVFDRNGYKVFTEGHSYGVMMDKGNVLALYSDLNAMYNVKKEELPDIFILE